jgi:TolB-like protein/Tfp pilus assembly protein PilF
MEALPKREPRIVRFGVFEADLDAGELRRRGRRVRIQDQPFRILEVLLNATGSVVTRDELRSRLWAGDTFVDFEHGLNAAINKLREALGDTASSPRYIETIPRRGYRFLVAPEGESRSERPRSTRAMLLVLPFRNASGDPAEEFFSDGLTTEMTVRLGRLNPQRLAVIATSSSMRFRSPDRPAERIARELGADHVLEGSVRRHDGRVRISAQLWSVADKVHLWANSYDRELSDEFEIQRDVAAQVAGALALEFAPSHERPSPQADRETREILLRARHFLGQRTPETLAKALACHQAAIARDPRSAEAHAGLAECYALFVDYGLMSPREAFPKVKEATLAALALDPAIEDAHTTLAVVRHRFEWNWGAALETYEQAIRLNPSCSTARHVFAQYLSEVGRHDDALAMIAEARRLSPLAQIIGAEEACILVNARRYDEAELAVRRVLELDDRFAPAHYSRFRAALAAGRKELALECARRAVQYSGGTPHMLAALAIASAHAGDAAEARAILARLGSATSRYVSPVQSARVLVALGEHDRALEWLEKGFASCAFEMTDLRIEPEWDLLRDRPEFRGLVARMGFPA